MTTSPSNTIAWGELDNALGAPKSVVSVSPIVLSVPGRGGDLQLRVSAPVVGTQLPVILFAHGFGSSMDGYAPLANFWASRGFVVIQPTFLDSKSLNPNPPTTHEEAIQAFLEDPRKLAIWRDRVEDMRRVLDHFDFIEESVPGLKGRIDQTRIAAAGHSFGAQTVAQLLGARVVGPDGTLEEDFTDSRIKAAVLLSATGRGGDALSPFTLEHLPALNQRYDEMRISNLVIAGDNDHSPLTVEGPEWFTDVYTLSPGADWLLTLFGGEHMLGGISGYQVTETTDENPQRVAAVQRLTCAYLRSALFPEDKAWSKVRRVFSDDSNLIGKVIGKSLSTS